MIHQFELKVDVKSKKLIYPDGITYGRETTVNFSKNENFVVFECVHNLLASGYLPKHITLEPPIPGGHGENSAFGDILIKDNDDKAYLLIECKTTNNKNSEFSKEWKKMLKNGGQLFNYFNTYRSCKFLCLYTVDFQEINNKESNSEKNYNIEQAYYLISMTDNDTYLASNTNLISFKSIQENNGGKDEYFKVWKNTYQNDYISHNLFESEIFNIGNRPYNISDLKLVGESTIKKKYHQFATIMRQYNVSGRENAFDKLVNLFLCKVVDEKNNPGNLKVYWKGASSDDHFSLQDRLQKLYKDGMEAFLGEEVTYIEESEIENTFKWFKNKKDETRDAILNYFKQLKFYSNNAFSFIDVHNKDLFVQNAIILKEVVQMLQDIRLKNEDEQHQFLGDLFEGFLDQGVKQSEGQFFTPMPIVKFLISSLPLQQLIDSNNIPKVIDYACGAGHFLTEYANQLKGLIGADNNELLAQHYQNIYGIEKEYRLSKVAKVSAFMYGQDNINIMYADALANNQNHKIKINDGEFSLLVANPPYSVKGFLETLSVQDKESFELYQNLNDDTFNKIECFFVERAKQLLKSDGIAVIVLKSTILTNTQASIDFKTREIILKYFDLIAIAEFGSSTFGKTTTNTATLFLKRKQHKPDISKHYANRVEEWFNGNFDKDIEYIFSDSHLLESYCDHCGFDFKVYKDFLLGKDFTIFDNELFVEYRKEFKKIEKDIKSKGNFKKLSKQEQEQLLSEQFFKYALQKEKEKVYFYLLALDNKNDVLVVKSPADNKANKEFLGYEWSSAKGNEGIKYIGGTKRKDDEDNSLEVLKDIKKINTPLFNPNNLNDNSKINYLIREHFKGNKIDISEQNSEFVSLLPLTKMINFTQVNFDNAIRTNIQKKFEIMSKYPLCKLKRFISVTRGVTYDKSNQVNTKTNNIILPADNISLNGHLDVSKIIYLTENLELDDAKRLRKNDIFMCFSSGSKKHIGKLCLITQDTNYYAGGFMGILRINDIDEIKPEYLFNLLNQENMRDAVRQLSNGSNIQNLSGSIEELKIPKPPLDIQQKIIDECQKIDEKYYSNQTLIENHRKQIEDIFNQLNSSKFDKIDNLCFINSHSITLNENEKDKAYIYVDIDAVENGTGKFSLDKRILSQDLPSRAKRLAKPGSTLISTVRPNLKGFAYIENEIENSIFSTGFAILKSKDEKVLLNPMIYYLFMYSKDLMEQIEKAMPKGQYPSINRTDIENFVLPVLDITEQQKIVTQIQFLENKIKQAEKIMSESGDKKKAILEKYLQE